MNDYFASRLAHERQADYLREADYGGARRLLITAVAAVALALAFAAPVAADNASYPGCSYFGAVATGDYAPHGALGELVKQYAPTGPGVLSGIVQEEHGLFCAPH